MPFKSGFISIRNSQCVIRNGFLHILSELVKESDSGFQIANDEFINTFEIRLYIHSQSAICHPESISSHPLRIPFPGSEPYTVPPESPDFPDLTSMQPN